MVNAIGNSSVNSIQMFNALNAFKGSNPIEENNILPDVSEGLEVNDKSILQSQDLTEIKEFAKIVGEDNLSNDDIQYGLTYGRSVIADYLV